MWRIFFVTLNFWVHVRGRMIPASLKGLLQIEENESSQDNTPSEKSLPNVGDLFEGDIIMDNALRRAVLSKSEKKSVASSSLENGPNHWPNAVVPYDFDASLLPINQEKIFEAIVELAKFTCVRFIPRSDSEKDFVRFASNNEGCSSSVGRKGGMQYIQLGNGCQRIGTVLHEMMHAIGFIHEQSRPDRNNYVEVKFENIKPSLLDNFHQYSFGAANNLNIPYNYWSVMHYSNDAFSANGKATLVAKVDGDLKFGQRIQLSHLDVQQINQLYPCPNPKVSHYSVDYLIQDMTPEIAAQKLQTKEDENLLNLSFRKTLSED